MSDDFPGDEDKSPMPEERFPDGFGMSVEDVRALLAKKHDVSVPQDDPILMLVTILQVFLEAQARLQKKHETALAAFMGQQTTAYVKDMEKNLKSLTETLSGLTMEGIRKAVADFVANLATHRSAMYLVQDLTHLRDRRHSKHPSAHKAQRLSSYCPDAAR